MLKKKKNDDTYCSKKSVNSDTVETAWVVTTLFRILRLKNNNNNNNKIKIDPDATGGGRRGLIHVHGAHGACRVCSSISFIKAVQ